MHIGKYACRSLNNESTDARARSAGVCLYLCFVFAFVCCVFLRVKNERVFFLFQCYADNERDTLPFNLFL